VQAALLDGEFGENDYIGNPQLDPETANGIDLGFEHRLGRKGIVGLNFFYRDVKDLIELSTVLDDAGDPVRGRAQTTPP
jgi:outer membrane receptor protein involved in Fe transport